MSTTGISQPQHIHPFTKCNKPVAIPQETSKTFVKTESIFDKIRALFLKPHTPTEFEKAHSEFYIPKLSPVNEESNIKHAISTLFERFISFIKSAMKPKEKAPVIITGRQPVRVDYKIVNNNRTNWYWFIAEEPIYGEQK